MMDFKTILKKYKNVSDLKKETKETTDKEIKKTKDKLRRAYNLEY